MNNFDIIDVMKAADTIVKRCVAVKPEEQVLIIADNNSDFLVVQSFTAAARAAGTTPVLMVITPRQVTGQFVPVTVQKAVDAADVVFSAATTSTFFTPAIRQANQDKRMRFVAMSVNADMMVRGGLTADPDEVEDTTTKLAHILGAARMIHITSEQGTDLAASLAGMPSLATGAFGREPGDVIGLPFGEVPQAPTEETAQGVVVIDTSMHTLGLLSEPIRINIKSGRAVSIEGGPQAVQLRETILGVENGDVLAEIALGTNPQARITGNVQEDKKRWGTVHIGFGNNTGLGGTLSSEIHLDGVILEPTVEVDGQVIVEKGKLKIEGIRPSRPTVQIGQRVYAAGEEPKQEASEQESERGDAQLLQVRLVTEELIRTVPKGATVRIGQGAIMTPLAQDVVEELGISIVRD